MPVQSALITPQEAELVWKSQARPSARTMANALTHAGRRVHFTTVARWITIAKSSDPLAGMQGVRTPDSAEHETGLAEDEGQKFRTIPCGGNDSQRLCPLGSHKKCPSVPSPTDGLFHAYSGDEQIFEHIENKPPDMEGTMTFKPGVSGNPHGNRHRTRHLLNQEFMQALLLNFRHEGKRAIEKVARNQPGVYLKILALLVPRELKVEQSQGVKAMSDEQLEQAIEALQAMLEQQAKVIEHTTETIALPAPDVVPDGPNKVMDAADTAVGTRERKLRKGRVSSLSGG